MSNVIKTMPAGCIKTSELNTLFRFICCSIGCKRREILCLIKHKIGVTSTARLLELRSNGNEELSKSAEIGMLKPAF